MGYATDDMTNPLRGPDKPADPYVQALKDSPLLEEHHGTRHPSRFEPKPTIRPTQTDAVDGTHVYRNGALNVSNGDILHWDTSLFDTQGMWNGSTTFTIPSTGKNSGPWNFSVAISWSGAGGGSLRAIDLLRNGVSIATNTGPATTISQSIHTTVYSPSNGDTFTVKASQDSGGALAVTVGSTNMYFEVVHPW
jgi:hypothetical protein